MQLNSLSVYFQKCSVSEGEYLYYRLKVWPFIDLSIASVIPFTVTIICNIAICAKLIWSKRKLTMQISSADGPNIKGMTVLLLSTSCMFLLLTLPVTVYLSIDVAWRFLTIKSHNTFQDAGPHFANHGHGEVHVMRGRYGVGWGRMLTGAC